MLSYLEQFSMEGKSIAGVLSQWLYQCCRCTSITEGAGLSGLYEPSFGDTCTYTSLLYYMLLF